MPQSGPRGSPATDVRKVLMPALSIAAATVVPGVTVTERAVDHDLHGLAAHAAVRSGIARAGSNAAASIGECAPVMPATMMAAVPVAVVMPSPS